MLLSVTIPTRERLSCLLNKKLLTVREHCLRLKLSKFWSCLYHRLVDFLCREPKDTSNLYQLSEERKSAEFKSHIPSFR